MKREHKIWISAGVVGIAVMLALLLSGRHAGLLDSTDKAVVRLVGGDTSVDNSTVSKLEGGGSSKGKAGIEWIYSKPAGIEFSKTEVTVAQYRACINAGNCTESKSKSDSKYCNWGHSERDNHPINCVDWNQATAFCEWAGGRLPTEQEWEKEASNSGSRTYPWGNQKATCDYAVMDQGGDGCGRDSTWPVCSKERGNSVSGLCDMSGNLFEWTSSWYDNERKYRVVRGGSWNAGGPEYLRASYRAWGYPSAGDDDVGFRCGRSSEPPKTVRFCGQSYREDSVSIWCIMCDDVEDLTPLKDIKNLRELHLSYTKVRDLNALRDLKNLESLDIQETKVDDVTPLKDLKRLSFLGLSGTRISDLEPLKGLENLQQLLLSGTTVTDLTPLRNLKKLEMLDLYYTPVRDLTPTRDLGNLMYLECRETKVSDLSPLKKLKNMRRLDLNGSQVVDLTPLNELENLKELFLGDTNVHDIAPLKGLKHLERLDLSNTQVMDLTPLKDLENLKELFLSDTQAKDLVPLRETKNLWVLTLGNTRVTDIAPLKDLKKLQVLVLNGTEVTVKQIEAIKKSLPDLIIDPPCQGNANCDDRRKTCYR